MATTPELPDSPDDNEITSGWWYPCCDCCQEHEPHRMDLHRYGCDTHEDLVQYEVKPLEEYWAEFKKEMGL